MTTVKPDRIEEAVVCIAGEIRDRLLQSPKASHDERALWAELSCCMLSSQVPYEMAKAAAERISGSGILFSSDPPRPETLTAQLLKFLLVPFPLNDRYRRYRFPNIRSAQIAAAFCMVSREFGSLKELLNYHRDPRCTRAWLAMHAPGVGPKQASMFLRNVGASYDLAVIDRHVLRYMHTIDLCRTLKGKVTNIGEYERHETQLRQHAESLGYPVGLFDWAIWIVMRAASTIEEQ